MRTFKIALTGISLAAAVAFASPAFATSTVAVTTPCDSLTDGDALGCKFTANINMNGNPADNESYIHAQDAYNAWSPGGGANDITLTPLADLNPNSLSDNGITIVMNGDGNGGTFTLDPGIDLGYFAVKSGNNFFLYEYIGNNTFTTDGLQMGNSDTPPGLSHIIFFGTEGGVPEPATWAMMLLGVGMIGSSMRRRRKNQARPVVLA